VYNQEFEERHQKMSGLTVDLHLPQQEGIGFTPLAYLSEVTVTPVLFLFCHQIFSPLPPYPLSPRHHYLSLQFLHLIKGMKYTPASVITYQEVQSQTNSNYQEAAF
jgi:hypothetical protein